MQGSSTKPWSANWSRDATNADKDHDTTHCRGKDGKGKGAGNNSFFRARAPFSREARTAQTSCDRADKRSEHCFERVSLVCPSVWVKTPSAWAGGRQLGRPCTWATCGTKLGRSSAWTTIGTTRTRPGTRADTSVTTRDR